jgi:hypothetical protein
MTEYLSLWRTMAPHELRMRNGLACSSLCRHLRLLIGVGTVIVVRCDSFTGIARPIKDRVVPGK